MIAEIVTGGVVSSAAVGAATGTSGTVGERAVTEVFSALIAEIFEVVGITGVGWFDEGIAGAGAAVRLAGSISLRGGRRMVIKVFEASKHSVRRCLCNSLLEVNFCMQ